MDIALEMRSAYDTELLTRVARHHAGNTSAGFSSYSEYERESEEVASEGRIGSRTATAIGSRHGQSDKDLYQDW